MFLFFLKIDMPSGDNSTVKCKSGPKLDPIHTPSFCPYMTLLNVKAVLVQVSSRSFFIDASLKLECSVFPKKSEKNLLLYSHFCGKDLSREYSVVWRFLVEVPEFKENVLICVITVKKVRDL